MGLFYRTAGVSDDLRRYHDLPDTISVHTVNNKNKMAENRQQNHQIGLLIQLRKPHFFVQMLVSQGNLGLYKSQPARLGSFAKLWGLPRGMLVPGID